VRQKLHPVQKAFMAYDALQCGFCTPGFHRRSRRIFTTAGGRRRERRWPSREEIGAALSGHLCRCGAYDGIFRARGRTPAPAASTTTPIRLAAAHGGTRQGDGRGKNTPSTSVMTASSKA